MTAALAMKRDDDPWLAVEAVIRQIKPTSTEEDLAEFRLWLEQEAAEARAIVAGLDAETDTINRMLERLRCAFDAMARPSVIDPAQPPDCPGMDAWLPFRQIVFHRFGAHLPEDPADLAALIGIVKRKHASPLSRNGQKQIRQAVMNALAGRYRDWTGEPPAGINTRDRPDHPWSRLTSAVCLWLHLGSPHKAARKAANALKITR